MDTCCTITVFFFLFFLPTIHSRESCGNGAVCLELRLNISLLQVQGETGLLSDMNGRQTCLQFMQHNNCNKIKSLLLFFVLHQGNKWATLVKSLPGFLSDVRTQSSSVIVASFDGGEQTASHAGATKTQQKQAAQNNTHSLKQSVTKQQPLQRLLLL